MNRSTPDPDPTPQQVTEAFHEAIAQEAELYRQAIRLMGAHRIVQSMEACYEQAPSQRHRPTVSRFVAWAAERLHPAARNVPPAPGSGGDIIEGEVISIDDTGADDRRSTTAYPSVIIIPASTDDPTDR